MTSGPSIPGCLVRAGLEHDTARLPLEAQRLWRLQSVKVLQLDVAWDQLRRLSPCIAAAGLFLQPCTSVRRDSLVLQVLLYVEQNSPASQTWVTGR